MAMSSQRVRFGGSAGLITAHLFLLVTLFAVSMVGILYYVTPSARGVVEPEPQGQAELLSAAEVDRQLADLLRPPPGQEAPLAPEMKPAPEPKPESKPVAQPLARVETLGADVLEVTAEEQEVDVLDELKAYNEEMREERRRRAREYDAEVARLRAAADSAMASERAAHDAPTSISIGKDGMVSGGMGPDAANTPDNVRLGGYGADTLDAYKALERDSYVSAHRVEKLKSPYYLRQGSVIPAVLISGINSDLPGQISAQVTRNIYDSPTGQHLLIPSGTMLVGQYMSHTAYGQERVFSGFTRLLFPDGKSLNLGAMPAQSTDGYAGFAADVNNHYFKMFMGAFFIAGFGTADAITYDKAYDSKGKPRPGEMMGMQYEHQAGGQAIRIAERNMNINPTLSVKPGTLFSVAVTKDLYLDGDYGF